MRFRQGAKLDPGQVTDVRGRRGGRGLAVGGGVGLGVLVIYVLFSLPPAAAGSAARAARGSAGQGDDPGVVSEECRTGADANERQDCFIVGVVNSTQEFWDGVFERSGEQYPTLTPSSSPTRWRRPAGRRPPRLAFYCPADQLVYIDLGFFDELQSRFGAGEAPFAQAYVIAHEYGHHVQNQLGILESIGGDRQGPESRAVRAELQADCYAGVWAANAVETGLIEQLPRTTSTPASTRPRRSATTASRSRRRAR